MGFETNCPGYRQVANNFGDIDGDSDQDIMFGDIEAAEGSYFENTGDITLDENDINLPTRYISSGLQRGPTDIEMADINGDEAGLDSNR